MIIPHNLTNNKIYYNKNHHKKILYWRNPNLMNLKHKKWIMAKYSIFKVIKMDLVVLNYLTMKMIFYNHKI